MICSKRQLYTLYICAKLLKPTDNFIRKRIYKCYVPSR